MTIDSLNVHTACPLLFFLRTHSSHSAVETFQSFGRVTVAQRELPSLKSWQGKGPCSGLSGAHPTRREGGPGARGLGGTNKGKPEIIMPKPFAVLMHGHHHDPFIPGDSRAILDFGGIIQE